MPVHEHYPQYLDDQRQFFDELITEDWETYQSDHWNYTRTFEIKCLFDRIRPASILDIGCGCGFHDQVMAEYPFVEQVDAIDYSEQSILKANEVYPHPKVQRTVADFATFSSNRPYDLVVSFQVFEHLSNPDEYLDFCERNCASGGFVAIVTPNRLRLDNRVRQLKGQPPILVDVMHYREYSIKELKAMGQEYGLKPYASFGHSLNSLDLFGRAFLNNLTIEQQTWAGYYLPHIARVITVLMRKG